MLKLLPQHWSEGFAGVLYLKAGVKEPRSGFLLLPYPEQLLH